MKGMTIIVKTITSWVKMLIFLFGIYIILFGHLTPGGGFAGGTGGDPPVEGRAVAEGPEPGRVVVVAFLHHRHPE